MISMLRTKVTHVQLYVFTLLSTQMTSMIVFSLRSLVFCLWCIVVNKRITGGAMQLSFSSITLDYYPFHRAGINSAVEIGNLPNKINTVYFKQPEFINCISIFIGDSCAHWMHYSDATKTRESWARSLLDEFRTNVEMLKSTVRDQQGPSHTHSSPKHGKSTHAHTQVLGAFLLYPQHITPVGFLSSSVP